MFSQILVHLLDFLPKHLNFCEGTLSKSELLMITGVPHLRQSKETSACCPARQQRPQRANNLPLSMSPCLLRYCPFQVPVLLFNMLVLFHVCWSNTGESIKWKTTVISFYNGPSSCQQFGGQLTVGVWVFQIFLKSYWKWETWRIQNIFMLL